MNSVEQRPLAVVTGASSGIGLALAGELASRGFDLIVAANDEPIHEAARSLESHGGTAEAVQCDLRTSQGVEQLAERARTFGRPVTALLVNAGVGQAGAFVDTDLTAHLELVALNVVGSVHLAGLLLPQMAAQGVGRVMFTSSIAATMPGPYMSTYNASKSFLFSFAEALRSELADSGVTVTALMPGPTDTNFFTRADMEDTKLGQMKRDAPEQVAKEGIDAMLAGDDHIVPGSFKNRLQTAAAKVMPAEAMAAAHARMSEPGSGE